MPLFSWEKLVAKGNIILAPNAFVAQQLIYQYNKYQYNLAGNKKAWPTITILPINKWLENIWQNWLDRPSLCLLTDYQESILWEKIIANACNDEKINNVNRLATYARKAWEFAQRWQIKVGCLNNYESDTFQKWVEKYLTACKENHFLDRSRLPDVINRAVSTDKILLRDSTIILLDFGEIPLQFKKLLSVFEVKHNHIIYSDTKFYEDPSESRLNFDSQDEEILLMARWAKDRWMQNQNISIGCIVTNIDNTLRDKITYFFKELFPTFSPVSIYPGEQLNSFAIIRNALNLLQLEKIEKTIEVAFIIELLRSPFLRDANEEMLQRADGEMKIRSFGKTHLNWNEIYECLKACPLFQDLLNKNREYYLTIKDKELLPSQWVNHFINLLKTLGWPGEHGLSDRENHILLRWQNLLSEFSTLDLILDQCKFSEATKLLITRAATTFVSLTAQKPPIIVIEARAAIGMSFDHLWVMGLSSENWPPQISSNPFIPIKYQQNIRKISVKFLTDSIRKSGEIIYSLSPDADGHFSEVSSFLLSVPEINKEYFKISSFAANLANIDQLQRLEEFVDEKAPLLAPQEKFQGGSKALELQKICPFRAFAECRLKAQEFPEPLFGISKGEHGILLHGALERIWQSLKGKKQLEELHNLALQEIIDRSVAETLVFYKEKLQQFSDELLNIERLCLLRLLKLWLDVEKKRDNFQVIATEKNKMTNIGPLTLKLRIDRIDRLTDGSLIIIDYKTGKNLPNFYSWFTESPQGLQLPLYSISSEEPISGLVLAKINISAQGFVGITKKANQMLNVSDLSILEKHKLSTNWDEWQTIWRQDFEKLAIDFYSGNAAVDPKDPAQTCAFCDIASICRKNNFPC